MREGSEAWFRVCALDEIVPYTGVAARFGDVQVAIFRFGPKVYSVGNRDPVTGAGVLARGLLGDQNGEPKITSPLYKESYSLRTGACFENPELSIPVFPTRVSVDGTIEVSLDRRSREFDNV